MDEAALNDPPANAAVLATPLKVAGLLQDDAEVAGALGVGRVAGLLGEDGGAQPGALGAGAELLDGVGQREEGVARLGVEVLEDALDLVDPVAMDGALLAGGGAVRAPDRSANRSARACLRLRVCVACGVSTPVPRERGRR